MGYNFKEWNVLSIGVAAYRLVEYICNIHSDQTSGCQTFDASEAANEGIKISESASSLGNLLKNANALTWASGLVTSDIAATGS